MEKHIIRKHLYKKHKIDVQTQKDIIGCIQHKNPTRTFRQMSQSTRGVKLHISRTNMYKFLKSN